MNAPYPPGVVVKRDGCGYNIQGNTPLGYVMLDKFEGGIT